VIAYSARILSLTFIAVGFIIFTIVRSASSDAAIQWQVDNPFRFFRFESDFEIQRWAYSQLSDLEKVENPASASERKLNNPRWWAETDAAGKSHLDLIKTLRQHEKRLVEHEPRLGWASLLRRDTNDTCWNASTQLHRDCVSHTISVTPESSYLDPKAHRVTAWLTNGNAQATCRWTADSPIFFDSSENSASPKLDLSASCDSRIRLLIPSEGAVQVSVSGDTSGKASDKISVKNLIIVGLGDSLASGEGNPDVPVKLDTYQSIAPGYDEENLLKAPKPSFDQRIRVPRRENQENAAIWIDRRCHRSAYSWQLHTALGVALTEPQHRSVTFLSYACSGAEILEGLLYPWDGKETIARGLTKDGRKRLTRPQIDGAVDELCRDPTAPQEYSFDVLLDPADEYVKAHSVPRDRVNLRLCPKDRMRPIDLLLIDIGVNDVGFGRLVANMVLTNGTSRYPGQVQYSDKVLRKLAGVISFDLAREKLAQLKPRFEALHSVIKDRLKFRDDDESRVLFAAYPPLVSAEKDDRLCPTGRKTMTISEIFEVKRESVVEDAYKFNERDMLPKLEEYVRPWTFEKSHRTRFIGHGYCAFSSGGPDESGKGTAEIPSMPYMLATGGNEEWQYFNPNLDLFPYESRTRWFRTFNDDYMIINYFKNRAPPLEQRYNNPVDLAQIPKSGPMHPTAEGQAHIADAVIKTARKILKIGGSSD
jgi:hypothetical protein